MPYDSPLRNELKVKFMNSKLNRRKLDANVN